MDDDFGEWVESMGAAGGWKLWVWLEYRGVVSGCCYKEVHVYNYIDILIIIITFPYSTCISFFWQQHRYFFVHFQNVFFFL